MLALFAMQPRGVISVIIPTYGQFDYVFKLLETLARYTSDYYCVLLDDASPDWTPEIEATIRRIIPADRLHLERREENVGLTELWNHGLRLSRDWGLRYAALVNSDTLFTPGWLYGTIQSLERMDLMGPMSNAPGTTEHQMIQSFLRGYRLDDSADYLAEVAATIARKFAGKTGTGLVNGFWMAARTQTWWDNRFDETHVFNPANRLTGNETEFQKRFRGRIGSARDVFIFHYRSVSRGIENVNPEYNTGAYRSDGASTGPGDPRTLLEFIPRDARRVLEVGCGAGALGAAIRQRQSAWVAGIEADPAGAQVAAGQLDCVLTGDAESVSLDSLLGVEPFDCVVFGGNLSRQRDPWTALGRCCELLRPAGSVVASIPNVRQFSTLVNLLFRGVWPVRESGLFQRSHLRWFTRQTINDLFHFANLAVDECRPWTPPSAAAFGPLRELSTAGYYVVGHKL